MVSTERRGSKSHFSLGQSPCLTDSSGRKLARLGKDGIEEHHKIAFKLSACLWTTPKERRLSGFKEEKQSWRQLRLGLHSPAPAHTPPARTTACPQHALTTPFGPTSSPSPGSSRRPKGGNLVVIDNRALNAAVRTCTTILCDRILCRITSSLYRARAAPKRLDCPNLPHDQSINVVFTKCLDS